jgi:primary-amine oxidase
VIRIQRLACVVGVLFSIAALPPSAPAQPGDDEDLAHPLDPLSAEEIELAAELLFARHPAPDDLLMPLVALAEPAKAELTDHEAGRTARRVAEAVLVDRRKNVLYEARVDLSAERVLNWRERPGKFSLLLGDEVALAEEIVRADDGWGQALAKRGITDLSRVFIEVWSPGDLPTEADRAGHWLRVLAYLRDGQTSPLGNPIEGVVALVDLGSERVVRLIDRDPVVPIPSASADYFHSRVRGADRLAPRPLVPVQSQGPSFELRGQEVRWQKWRFRYSLHPREGLVLHTVGYEDGGRLRPILHRASLSEMAVPYGDSDAAWNWRCPIDLGEFGLGLTANEQVAGRDVPENAALLDATLADEFGQPFVIRGAIALYERDGGMLWKHSDTAAGAVASRRGRELVIGFVATVGNYDYGLQWVFRQDGSLEPAIEMTGVPIAKAVASAGCEICRQVEAQAQAAAGAMPAGQTAAGPPAAAPVPSVAAGDQRFGILVAKNLVATNHQHMFSFRLDFAIDGETNSVAELNVRALPRGEDNPAGNAFVQEELLLTAENNSRRNVDIDSHRRWKVFNPMQRTALGHFTAYMLMPGENGRPLLAEDSSLRRRLSFLDQHVAVTRFRAHERFAAGDYPRQNPSPDGLNSWIGEESISGEDLVLWYTLVATHVPRPEDWPVMPTTRVGFRLAPCGFFDRNPALDVPATPARGRD